MTGHGIDVCECGAVVAQCRCMDHRERRVVCKVCPACAAQYGPRVVAAVASHEKRIQESYAVQALAKSMAGVNVTRDTTHDRERHGRGGRYA